MNEREATIMHFFCGLVYETKRPAIHKQADSMAKMETLPEWGRRTLCLCVSVCARACESLRQSAGLYVAAGSFMWPFVLFMCSCLSSALLRALH